MSFETISKLSSLFKVILREFKLSELGYNYANNDEAKQKAGDVPDEVYLGDCQYQEGKIEGNG